MMVQQLDAGWNVPAPTLGHLCVFPRPGASQAWPSGGGTGLSGRRTFGGGGTGPPLEPAVNRAGTGIQLGRRRERQIGVCVEVGVAGGGEAEERKCPLLSHSNSFLFRTSFPVFCSGLSFLLCFLMF